MKNVDIIFIYVFMEKIKSIFGVCPESKKGFYAHTKILLVRHIVGNRILNGEVIRLDGTVRMADK